MDANSTNSDAPQPEKPKGFWGTALTTLPIALALVATGFAGMSSSEMTQSMYYRSLAAQHQSKAGDQWGFFQAKRIRGTSLEMTADLLQNLGPVDSFQLNQVDQVISALQTNLEKAIDDSKASVKKEDSIVSTDKIKSMRERWQNWLAIEKNKQNLVCLINSALPVINPQRLPNGEAQKAIDNLVREIARRKTEAETAQSVRAINPADVDQAILLAEQDAEQFDYACEPIAATIQEFRGILRDLAKLARSVQKSFSNDALEKTLNSIQEIQKSSKSLELDFNSQRYRRESVYNRKAAELYEIRVRRSSVESDIHRERSKMFFYCMLIAQVAVMISSLALGRSQRILFLLAVFFGLASLGFGGYVSLLL